MSAWVYILRGTNGRHHIGSTVDLERRVAEHRRGYTHTTQRLGEQLELLGSKQFVDIAEARRVERELKAKKNPRLALYHLTQPQ
jgi:predicted GIY-YIG superfamily endonuclease